MNAGRVKEALEAAKQDVALRARLEGSWTETVAQGLEWIARQSMVAGARTVVASLWSVSDPATSVLMERFYANLWADKPMTRLEALRQAQLFVLKHPEAVRQRTRELREAIVKARRGSAEELRGKGKEVELAGDREKEKGERSHPAWWAAFVLSGDTGPIQP
jgi:CHAT domain-containing protein